MGMKPELVLGRGLSELLAAGLSHGCSADSLDSVLRLVDDSAETVRAVEMSSITPVPRHYLVTVFPRSTARNGTSTGITIKDVTAIRETGARQGRFQSGLAYQLRDPVTALMGFTSLLLENPSVDGDQRDWLENIRTCGQRLTAIVRDLLDLAAPESGDTSVAPAEASFDDVPGRSLP